MNKWKHGQGTHSTKMGADSPAENTPNASKNFCPKCLPKPKSSKFLKKMLSLSVRSLGMTLQKLNKQTNINLPVGYERNVNWFVIVVICAPDEVISVSYWRIWNVWYNRVKTCMKSKDVLKLLYPMISLDKCLMKTYG